MKFLFHGENCVLEIIEWHFGDPMPVFINDMPVQTRLVRVSFEFDADEKATFLFDDPNEKQDNLCSKHLPLNLDPLETVTLDLAWKFN